jgi:hypothetical protein
VGSGHRQWRNRSCQATVDRIATVVRKRAKKKDAIVLRLMEERRAELDDLVEWTRTSVRPSTASSTSW